MRVKRSFLEHLKPGPHPMRDFFRRHGGPYVMLASHCNCSVGWIGQLMAGYRPIPLQIAARMYELAERLEPGIAEPLLQSRISGAEGNGEAA